jgi:hypothetical protein
MTSLLEFYILSVLVFLLERLVYLENWWYEDIWSRWRPSSTTILDKLVLSKEDEIWHAVIFGNNGDIRKIFEDLTNNLEGRVISSSNVSSNGGVAFSSSNPGAVSSSGKIEAGSLFYRPKTKLQKAVETDIAENEVYGSRGSGYRMAVQARLEGIADRLANLSRKLTKKERQRAKEWMPGTVSVLWMAICRGHKSDVDYLLTKRNIKLHMQNTLSQETVLHKAVSKEDCDLVCDILEKSSSTSPETYINVGDILSRTALHNLVFDSVSGILLTNVDGLDKTLKIFASLSEYGANINALDWRFMTPLHLLLSAALGQEERNRKFESLIPLLDSLLLAGAEVNTKDMEGT